PDAACYRPPCDEQFVVASWSNVPYEADVYRHVLEPLRLSTPRFYGTYAEPGSGRLWLILEYFERAFPLNELSDGSNMGLASRWGGQFHAAREPYVNSSRPFLKTLDAAYYSAFASRVLSRAGKLESEFSWLPDLCFRFEDLAASMWPLRPTITHGDYYLNNIL